MSFSRVKELNLKCTVAPNIGGSVKLAFCLPSGIWNFEVASELLAQLCTPAINKYFGLEVFHFMLQ